MASNLTKMRYEYINALSYGSDLNDVTIQAAIDDIDGDERTLLIPPEIGLLIRVRPQ